MYLALWYRDEFSESKAMKAIESAEANLDSDSFDKVYSILGYLHLS